MRGPRPTAAINRISVTAPISASLWRRKRRQASPQSVRGVEERCCSSCLTAADGSTVGMASMIRSDIMGLAWLLTVAHARIEHAIDNIGDQVEQHGQDGEDECNR